LVPFVVAANDLLLYLWGAELFGPPCFNKPVGPKRIDRPMNMRSFLPALLLLVLAPACVGEAAPEPIVATVQASRETDPVDTKDDAADDPAIWIHPTDSAKSLLVGTDKKSGLGLYTLDGKRVQFVAGFQPNNVDLRQQVAWGDKKIDLVVASDRNDNSLALFVLDPATLTLQTLSLGKLRLPYEPYGLCMFCSPRDGACYIVVTTKTGLVEQFRVAPEGTAEVALTSVRKIMLAGQTEGCVADDAAARLYIGEETGTLWSFNAEPDGEEGREKIDAVRPGGNLVADIEGLALYKRSGSVGYLIASSQGDSTFCVYALEQAPRYLGRFSVAESAQIDAVSGTDGIDATAVSIGTEYPQGLFIAQDDENETGTQNFKIVPWGPIASAFAPK